MSTFSPRPLNTGFSNFLGGVALSPSAPGGRYFPSSTNYNPVFGGNVAQIPTVNGPNLGSVYPNLSGTNADLSSSLTSELTGQLSPQTLNSIQNAAASYGVSSGMPGSGMAMARYPRDVGLASEALTHQGVGDYSSAIPSVSSTQTVNPSQQASLNTEINATNAQNAAAPNPAASATYAQNLFDKYLQSLKGPAGGTQNSAPWWKQGTNATSFGYSSGIDSLVNHAGHDGFNLV